MKATELVLRCYAEQVGTQWQAVCLDLTLAAQADSFDEVRRKLESIICEYVHDAVVGQDREYAGELLVRRAPLKDWLKYYQIKLYTRLGRVRDNMRRFKETLPLTPCHP